MKKQDRGPAAPGALCAVCHQVVSDDPIDFGTRCLRLRMASPSTAAMVCFRLGYERLLSVIAEAPHADHCRTYSMYAPPWADDCDCWKRPFLPPEQQQPSDPAAQAKYTTAGSASASETPTADSEKEGA